MAFYCRKKLKRAEKSIPAPPSLYKQEPNPFSDDTMTSPKLNENDEDLNLQQQSAISSETLTIESQKPTISDHQQQQIEDPEEPEQEETEKTGMAACPPPPQPITDTHITITITIPDLDPVLENPPLTTPTTPSVSRRGATKRKKPMAAKKRQVIAKKLELLAKTFKPIPFLPNKTLDFSTHEKLLKRLGLWDFAHVELERNIRTDFLAQLVVTFSPQTRCGYINDTRINVSRADLARALKFPGKKDKVSAMEVEGDVEVVSEESIAFLEDFVSNWVLLHEDTWILPNEVLNWTRVIKEGHPEKVDWASLMWFMVEKEVAQGSRLGHCYYASHLQCLIKSQREALFVEEPIVEALFVEEPIVDVTVKEDEEDDAGEVKVSEDGGDVKMSEDFGHVKSSEASNDVKMGEDRSDMQMDEDQDDVKMVVDGVDLKIVEKGVDVKKAEKGDNVKKGDDVADVKMGEDGNHVKMGEDGSDVKMGVDGSDVKMGVDGGDVKMGNDGSYGGHELEEPNIELSLGKDSFEKEELVQDEVTDFEDCKEREPRQWLLNGMNNVGEHFLQRCSQDRGLVCDEEEKQEEEEDHLHEQEHLGGFTLLPKCNSIEAISSANLIEEIEASQVPYSSPMQRRDHSVMEQFTSRAEANLDSGGPSIFGNVSKREIDREHEISRQAINDNHKRLRSDEPWEQRSSDFDLCMENVQIWMGKAKLLYQEKEQTCTGLNVNQELLMNELQQRNNVIEHLHKLRFEEQQKSQGDIYRLERELFAMGDLLKGYRNALKETRRAFTEYRARCPLPDEPLYKDVAGSGGLVLSATELERQRLKQEEEENIKRIEIKLQVKKFEADWTDICEVHLNKADMLNSKLLDVAKEVKLLKDIFSERKGSLAAESPPNE